MTCEPETSHVILIEAGKRSGEGGGRQAGPSLSII
jgi:hypothetical protein